MSYVTHIPDPPRREVCRRCCRSCTSHMKSHIANVFDNHKLEVGIVFGIFSWIVTNTVLFAVAAIQTDTNCAPKKVWLIFGGLAFCLPTTIALIFGLFVVLMYFRRMYVFSIDETQRELNPDLYESWTISKSIHLDEAFGPPVEMNEIDTDPIVRQFDV